MNEKSLTVLEQYDINVKETYRTKGNYGCVTATGKFILQEYNNSEGRMKAQKCLGDYLYNRNVMCDSPIPNKEEKFISISSDGYPYILKKWFSARECNIQEEKDIIKSVEALAKFHYATQKTGEIWDEECTLHDGNNIIDSYEKHNKEMVKIKNYISKRKNKNAFEYILQKEIDTYRSQGELAITKMKATSYNELFDKAIGEKAVCHGSFNHHSIVIENDIPIIIGLRKICFGLQIYDFYGYLRKIMEKNDWNIELAQNVIETYKNIRGITKDEYEILWCMFYYPEKFWKIVNYYYNSNKAWTSEKNEEKLKMFQKQEEKRRKFTDIFEKKWV